MPDESFERQLEALLKYDEPAHDDTFAVDVMRTVRREHRQRKLILWIFGLVGALFGLAGAVMLSDSITRLFTFSLEMPARETMQVVLFIVAAVAFYTWFMNDDMSLEG